MLKVWQERGERREAGFTLLEVLVSLGIASICLPVITLSFIQHAQFNHDLKIKSEAISVAGSALDQVRTLPVNQMPTSGAGLNEFGNFSYTIAGNDYQVEVVYCQKASFCNADNRHIVVNVIHEGQQVYDVEVVYASFI